MRLVKSLKLKMERYDHLADKPLPPAIVLEDDEGDEVDAITLRDLADALARLPYIEAKK